MKLFKVLYSILFVSVLITYSCNENDTASKKSENIKPAELVDEAIQETIYNHALLRERLQVGQATAQKIQLEEIDSHAPSG